MPANLKASITVAFLLAAVAIMPSPLPTNPAMALLVGLGSLWVERGGFTFDAQRGHRFSPAVPLYLGLAMSAPFGSAVAALFVLLDAAYRMEQGFLKNLAQRLPLAVSLMLAAALNTYPVLPAWVTMLAVPLCYLVCHWSASLGGTSVGPEREQRMVRRQLQQRVRPLELGLAALSSLVAVGLSYQSWVVFSVLPLLACTYLAAENILLTATDETVRNILEKLRGAEAKARKAVTQRDKALQEKQLLEGFSQHLAGQPDLEAVSSKLVVTVGQLMSVDSVVVFLGSPPEPFSYRVASFHQEALQGAALTALREPIVDRAFEQKKPALQRKPPENVERLLSCDHLAAALPLGSAGVLYVGRQQDVAFSPSELERLKWLSGKAALAFEAALQVHEQARKRRLQEQTVHRLERRVAWLSQLVQGAEAMASSLQDDLLVDRLLARVSQVLPHLGGLLIRPGYPKRSWGIALEPHPELLRTALDSARPLAIENTLTSRFGQPSPQVASLVVAPLLAGQSNLGLLVLVFDKPSAFSSEQIDLLFLLCSQAAMALSNAALYNEVVEARRQLEESQASLIQSSKLTAIGQLAAGVAHELNSPLGAVSLSVGEALNQLDERPQLSRRLLEKASVAVGRAKSIVDRLLSYSRKPQNVLQTLSMETLTKETVEFLAFQLRSAGVVVEIRADERSSVQGEEQPLQQVVTNLVLNAASAMEERPEAERRLEIVITSSQEQVKLDFTDRGHGIAEENLQRVFDPFFTTKPVGRGTGLGLWACQQIVLQHGGTLSVHSQPEVGSTFTVTLPVLAPVAAS